MSSLLKKFPPPTHKNPCDLRIHDLKVPVDVLSFEGREYLSRPFSYTIRFTSEVVKEVFTGRYRKTQEDLERESQPQMSPHDIDTAAVLNRSARFALYGKAPQVFPWQIEPPLHEPLRQIFGVITAFERLGGSVDEGHYQVTLEPRFGLLGRGKQYRIYQHKSVPEIVESILRARHFMAGQDFFFDLKREYPRRAQVMQYGESDLAFVDRLLAEVGIWYRIGIHERLGIDVVHFNDWQCHFQFDIELPCLPPGGLSSTDKDGVWNLATRHKLVEKDLVFRSYDPRQAGEWLQDQIEQRNVTPTTYGETYEYALPYTTMGNRLDPDYGPAPESGHFFARLNHERNLTERSVLTGTSSSATLAPGQVLNFSGDIPQDFAKEMLIHHLSLSAARDKPLLVEFRGMPYSDYVCYRPPLKPKPSISGTVPARVSSSTKRDLYSHINKEGRYRVNFLFDRDEWDLGSESTWLRLARPYAGDTYGLHLPLIAGTEVAVAFEQGDPDRPYIAHALHDSRHPDHVAYQNHMRNVLRTPANNKLRMEDERGKEHVKLSTEHGGKSQLNLGHLVDSARKRRGEGFELRTDAWGALRAGKGIFISADVQPKGHGEVLNMSEAVAQLTKALELTTALAQSASVSGALPADAESQRALRKALNGLSESGLVASAPAGMALTTPQNIQLSAGATLTSTAGDSADFSVMKRFGVAAGEAISLFAQKLGMKIIAARGPVEIQAQSDAMSLQADKALSLSSVHGEITLNAEQGITLVSRGAYIKIKDGSIEIGAPGQVRIRNDNILCGGAASLEKALGAMTLEDPVYKNPMAGRFLVTDGDSGVPKSYVPYRMESDEGQVVRGVTDSDGLTQFHQGVEPQNVKFFFE